MTTALVTGSSGFVGRHMLRALVAAGWEVWGVDIKPGSADDVALSGGRLCEEDVRDWFDYRHHIDVVVHCAAVVGGRTMIDGRPAYLAAEDLSIDAALWRWALTARPSYVLYYSSSAAYPVGYQRGVPPMRLDEGLQDPFHPLPPDQSYGWVKIVGEQMADRVRAETARSGRPVQVGVLRPFSGYGSDQDDAYPFPAIIGRAVREEDPLVVWGSLTQARDWVHIDDVVRLSMAAIDTRLNGPPVNICTGRATTMGDLARLAAAEVGYSPKVRVSDGPSGVQHRVGHPGLMVEMLGVPTVTLEEGVARAVADRA